MLTNLIHLYLDVEKGAILFLFRQVFAG